VAVVSVAVTLTTMALVQVNGAPWVSRSWISYSYPARSGPSPQLGVRVSRTRPVVVSITRTTARVESLT
jgi:hypothetical protein